MGFLDSIGGFLSDNTGWLKPLAAVGAGLYQNNAQEDARRKLVDFYAKQEQENFDMQKANRDAYLAYLQSRGGGGGGRSGGGGGGGGVNTRAKGQAMINSIKNQQNIIRPFYQGAVDALPMQQSMYARAMSQLGDVYTNQLPMFLRDIGSTTESTNIPLSVLPR